ncbi:LPS export ABC transporter periplasmic protein LptC [Arcticibacter sp. MXS-1]|uniref:LPS export ABC transporter periplasmic protein LptC n=1 Tax=Arcticibacter sp. MXS-1 TaxID=3341726 RepID=UPI0035A8F467
MKRGFIWLLTLAYASVLLTACENDLREVEKVSSQKKSVPVDKSTGVEIIYSDSAKVKAKVITPELNRYHTKNPYYEMPKGATVIFFDENQKESSRIVSDYAIQHENSRVVEMRKNVVGTSVKGDVFKSDELIYDPRRPNPVYSTKLVTITQPNGNIVFGNGFSSDEDFKHWELTDATGNFPSGTTLIE